MTGTYEITTVKEKLKSLWKNIKENKIRNYDLNYAVICKSMFLKLTLLYSNIYDNFYNIIFKTK
jgi:hypothetical protein